MLPRYGPFYRLESPTQTPEDAARQVASQQIWGRRAVGAINPAVKAFLGPLPAGARGIEFYTNVAPDPGVHPRFPLWTRANPGLAIDDEWAKLDVMTTENSQT